MKTGRTLSQLASELERQTASRKDYIAPQGKIEAIVVQPGDGIAVADDSPNPRPGDIVLDGLNGDRYGLTPHAHRQFADHLGIPQKYYDRMQVEQPALLAKNINTWMHATPDDKRMIRTLDGRARAFMSPKYRPLDNFELAETVLPKLLDLGVEISSCELTETRMYIKGILPALSDALPEGLTWGNGHHNVGNYAGERGRVVAAIVVSNSEVGAGSLRVEPSVFTSWCTNLAVIAQASMKKYHVGRSTEAGDDFSIYRDETRAADDRAFWLKVQDVTAAAFDVKIFAAAIAQIRTAAGIKITSDDLPAVVDVAIETLALPERASSGLLTMLARGGDLTQWGLSSAITALSQADEYDYEQSTAMERAGGKVLALGAREWNKISTAVAA